MTLRVLVVEDHPLFRRGVVALLDAAGGIEVVGTATSGEAAVTQAAGLRPDVVLAGLRLPGMSGIGATRTILTADADMGDRRAGARLRRRWPRV